MSDPDIRTLFGEVCDRLHGIGVAVKRAALSWPTLHPLFRAEQVSWKLGKGAEHTQFRHESGSNAAWLASPFYYVASRNVPRLRRRLIGTNALIDFPVLEDLKGQGYTDYLVTMSHFKIAEFQSYADGETGIISTWATMRQEGFSDDDLEALSRIQRMLALACHSAIQKQVMTNLANTYLGPTASWRVLSGSIQRGSGKYINAVVWYSDLRDSTHLSETMESEDYLGLLNDYYECTAGPVTDHGGEILNFIGDGVLAIFPVKGNAGLGKAAAAASAAVSETLDLKAKKKSCASRGHLPLEFGVALAVGDVMFGNIGIPQRLAFSGIGPIVNRVNRVEQATKKLNSSVLATGEFAAAAPGDWRSVGPVPLRGVDEEIELFAPV
ncbi:MAG: adenylate/guanylate cyclase domain-containing protein [Pseudomonadota bacterium]